MVVNMIFFLKSTEENINYATAKLLKNTLLKVNHNFYVKNEYEQILIEDEWMININNILNTNILQI